MAERKPLSVCSMLLESQGSSMHWSLAVKQDESGFNAKNKFMKETHEWKIIHFIVQCNMNNFYTQQ